MVNRVVESRVVSKLASHMAKANCDVAETKARRSQI